MLFSQDYQKYNETQISELEVCYQTELEISYQAKLESIKQVEKKENIQPLIDEENRLLQEKLSKNKE